MSTISSSNGYSVSASTNNGFSGMVSGMDTEGLVQKMLSGTQSKIDRQSGQRQVSEWKQDIYRDATSSINKFQAKFFDFTSSTNLMSNTFFNQMKSTSTSSAFRVTGSSSAISGDMQVKIDQLATNTRLEGKSIAASNEIKGVFNPAAFDSSVSFDIAAVTGDATKPLETITLDATKIESIMTGTQVKETLASGDIITFSVNDGNLTITGGGRSVSVKGSTGKVGVGETTALGLEKFGLKSGMTSSLINGTITSKINEVASPKFEVSLDGINKTIEIVAGETNVTLQEKLDFAFGRVKNPVTLIEESAVKVNGTDLT
ncbi:MAG: flagellar cap protein FliD N-terminal domain-containing protein, partial [Oscillospiraceae bacterium]